MSSVPRYLGKVRPGVGMTSQGWRPRWNPDLANYVTAQAQREEAAELKAQAAVPPSLPGAPVGPSRTATLPLPQPWSSWQGNSSMIRGRDGSPASQGNSVLLCNLRQRPAERRQL